MKNRNHSSDIKVFGRLNTSRLEGQDGSFAFHGNVDPVLYRQLGKKGGLEQFKQDNPAKTQEQKDREDRRFRDELFTEFAKPLGGQVVHMAEVIPITVNADESTTEIVAVQVEHEKLADAG